MSACTCTNSLYEQVRPPANLTHQPKFDFHPTTAKTNSNPSRRPVRNKTVTLSEEKLSSCPEQTCHYPRFWPDSHCLKTSTRRLTCHLASIHQISELLSHRLPRPLTVHLLHPEHLPSNCFSPTTSSQAPNQPNPNTQANLLTPKPARCALLAPSSEQPVASCSAHSSRFDSPYRIHPQSFS